MMNITFLSAMDEFCGSKFWDSSLSWYTADPDLTSCFERTVLVWLPCAFLWTFTPLEVFYICHSKAKDIPWNGLNISKLLFTLFLCVLSIAEFINNLCSNRELYNVDIYTPSLKLLSFALSASLLIYNRKHGLVTSGLQFLFWLLLAICGAFQLRSEVRATSTGNTYLESYFAYIIYIMYYIVVLLMFILNCFPDKPPRSRKWPNSKKPCPEERSAFLAKIFFSWFDGFAWMGYRRPLVKDDLWDLKHENSAKDIISKFNKHWLRALPQRCHPGYTPVHQNNHVPLQPVSASISFSNSTNRKQPSVLPALVKSFGATFFFSAILNLIDILLGFIGPQILSLLINFAENKEEQWKGFLYTIILVVTPTAQILIHSQYFNYVNHVNLRINTALVATIYRKALKLSNSARKESTVGEIVNLMAVDAKKISDLANYLNLIWSAPLRIVLSVYFLWNILGPSVLAGLAVMVCLTPVNYFVANKFKNLHIKQMKHKDDRAKLMNEILNGIKVLKLYAWEPSFEKQVLRIRNREIAVLKQAAYMSTITSFIFACAPFLVILVSFTTFVMVDEKNVLDASTAFVSISLFNILRRPMSMFPIVISYVMQCYVSIKRVNKFMHLEDLNPDNVNHNLNEEACLVIEDGTFSWGEVSTLKNINVRLDRSTLTAVVGSVGAGKSSLISAFLGEMEKRSGRVNTIGSVAYVAQQAWIQNATLRDNIIFGKSFDKLSYEKVIDACALRHDLDMLPAGDKTEIGENGINLSGGQKQRVSLARAVYADADVYFLDDPLSAVDSHVGKHIFEQVIGPTGMLRGKTRILVTHSITFLPKVDEILVMKDGEISETGTYQELLDRNGAFAEFLVNYISTSVEADDIDLDELASELGDTLSIHQDLAKQLQRHRSRISESDSVSGKANGSLQRQMSSDSGDHNVFRKRRSSSDVTTKRSQKTGERLIDDEKVETGSVSVKIYRYYLKSIGFFPALVNFVMIFAVQAFGIGSSFWLAKWTSDPNLVKPDNTTDVDKRNIYLGVYGALGIGQGFASMISEYCVYVGGLSAANIIHEKILHNMLRVSAAFYDTTPSGRILSRFTKDIDIVDNRLPWCLSELINFCMKVSGTLFVISFSSPPFIAVIFVCGVLYYFIQRIYVETSRQLKRLESVSRSPIYSHFGETLTGVSTIRAYNHQSRFINESDDKLDQNQVCSYPSLIASSWLAVRTKLVGNLIILFAALFAVLGRDNMDAGLIGLSVSYALQITQTLTMLVTLTSQIETNIVAVERLKEYTETPQEAQWDIPNKAPPASWPDIGTVAFKNYSVRYRPELDLVLKKVTFSITGGERVGIVGRTGAGKSSLTLSLFRIIEAAEGAIEIDGVNIGDMGLHALRSRLTIIPQDPVLFSGSLRINLDPFDANSDEEVWTSLELAHLKSFVQTLPAGLSHDITEGGDNLSVGQRQLICLARALLRKTKVLILDEATAAVDLETDDLIQSTIRREFKDCTVLTIAHRLNTIMDSDRVIVLDKGIIAEFDTPQYLLKSPTIFRSMCQDAGLF